MMKMKSEKPAEPRPKNVREFVLQGNRLEGWVQREVRFTGPNTAVCRGEQEPDVAGPKLVFPFVEKVRFRPGAKAKKAFRDMRTADGLGFEMFAGSVDSEEDFTGPHTMVRRGEWDVDFKGITVPFTAKIKFGRPRLTAR